MMVAKDHSRRCDSGKDRYFRKDSQKRATAKMPAARPKNSPRIAVGMAAPVKAATDAVGLAKVLLELLVATI